MLAAGTENDVHFDLLRRIRDRHFIEQKTQADVCPIVVRRIIDAIPDGYDPHARVPQILQLDQTSRIASGESAQILDDEDIVLPVIRYGRIR